MHALLVFVLLPSAFADIQAPPRPHAKGERLLQRRGDGPATALPQEDVLGDVGQTISITLRGEGEPGRSLNFEVRTQPRHGSITGEPSRLTRNSVRVFYVPIPGDNATEDEFTFSAQVPGGAVSAPQTVRLRLTPLPPQLAFSPLELDFGAVKAGDSAQGTLTLENQGGSQADGRIDPPPPFVVDGPAEYHLPRGARQTFRLVFQPTHEASFNDALHLQYETGNGVRLIGTGLRDPNAAVPVDLGIAKAAGDQPGIPVTAGSGKGTSATFPVAASTPAVVKPAVASVAAVVAPVRSAALSLDRSGAGSGWASSSTEADTTLMPVNEAAVQSILVDTVGRSTVDMTWKPPTPAPASYRVELAYLLTDDDKARLDWRPYARTEIKPTSNLVSAHLRGLPAGRVHMLRVVAVDSGGRLSAPSQIATIMTQPAATWWRPTIPKLLGLLLVFFAYLLIRRRLEERRMLADIDDSRRRANADAGIAWRN